MPSSKRSIALTTGGGDCPGLNAAVTAAYYHATANHGLEVIGLQSGLSSLFTDPAATISIKALLHRNLFQEGGTILGANNKGNPLRDESQKKTLLDIAKRSWKRLGLSGMLVVGGDGTQFMARSLCDIGLPIVGIPKTIDNDLVGSETTIGFATAVSHAADAALRLRSTADAHNRVMVLEVMGRHAGHIAIATAIAARADACLIPESPFELTKLIKHIKKMTNGADRGYLVVAAEAAHPIGGDMCYRTTPTGKKRLGGIGEFIAEEIERATGIEARACAPGHILRGGAPTAADQILASTLAVQGIDYLAKGESGFILMRQGNKTVKRSYSELKDQRQELPLDHELVYTAKGLGITFAS